MNLVELNHLATPEVHEILRQLCGSDAWCRNLATRVPFANTAQLHEAADATFDELSDGDWIEAFSCHPKIGDIDSLRMKFTGNKQWSAGEQSGMSQADEQTIEELAEGNRDYQARFGHIFIVSASGKSASEMLALLKARLPNDAETELAIAANEQRKITHLRIDKLLNQSD